MNRWKRILAFLLTALIIVSALGLSKEASTDGQGLHHIIELEKEIEEATMLHAEVTYGYTEAPMVQMSLSDDANEMITYQWKKSDGTIIEGATEATLFNGLDVGTYSCDIYVNDNLKNTLLATVKPKEITPIVTTFFYEKVYDGTAKIEGYVPFEVTLDGVVDGDDVRFDTTNVTYEFADANIGNVNHNYRKKIIAKGFTLIGAKANNYILTTETLESEGILRPFGNTKENVKTEILLDKTAFTYNGKEYTANVTKVLLNGVEIPTEFYTVTNHQQTEVGTYYATVIFSENYEGTAQSEPFTIAYLDTSDVLSKLTYNNEKIVKNYYTKDVVIQAEGYQISDSIDGEYTESYTLQATTDNMVLYFKDANGYITNGINIPKIVVEKTGPSITNVVKATMETDGLKDTSATISFTASEVGNYSYLLAAADKNAGHKILKEGNIAISSDTIKVESATNSAIPWKKTDMLVGTNRFTIEELSPNTSYIVYLIAENEVGGVTQMEISFTTKKTVPTITKNPTITGIYGDAVKDMTLSVGEAEVEGTWAITPQAKEIPKVGTTNSYIVTFTPKNTDRYTSVDVAVVPTIEKKEIVVEIKDIIKTFGAENPKLTFKVSKETPLVKGDTTNDLNIVLSTTAVQTSNVGAYAITGTANASNYNVIFDEGVCTVQKAKAPVISKIKKEFSYKLGSNGDYVSIPLKELLPNDSGESTYMVSDRTAQRFLSEKSIKNGVLRFKVGSGSVNHTANIIVDITSQNYNDTSITVNIKLVDKQFVSLDGKITTEGTLTYGEKLRDLTFGTAKFVDAQGNPIAGTLVWNTPNAMLYAGTHTVGWTFVPKDSGRYLSITDSVDIEIAKATPNATIPTPNIVTYDPNKTLADIPLPHNIMGTWAWKDASIVPTVGNTGYIAVFTPTDTVNYDVMEKTIAVEVAKATLQVTAPTVESITYGKTLADVNLTIHETDIGMGTWAWKDASIVPTVASSDSTKYEVVFTPTDTNNYDIIESFVTITVFPYDISHFDMELEQSSFTYNGMAQTVKIKNIDFLAENIDYTIAGNTQTQAGIYTVTITGIGNFTGTITKDFSISYLNFDNHNIQYNGKTVLPWYCDTVVITANGYTISETLTGTFTENYNIDKEVASGVKLYFKEITTGYITDAVELAVFRIDKTAPSFGEDGMGIKIREKSWTKLLEVITAGLFCIGTQDITLEASDEFSGIAGYYYYVDKGNSTTIKTTEELDALNFTAGKTFSIDKNDSCMIYAYAVDNAGNRSEYIHMETMKLDVEDSEVAVPSEIEGTEVNEVIEPSESEEIRDTEVIEARENEDSDSSTGDDKISDGLHIYIGVLLIGVVIVYMIICKKRVR